MQRELSQIAGSTGSKNARTIVCFDLLSPPKTSGAQKQTGILVIIKSMLFRLSPASFDAAGGSTSLSLDNSLQAAGTK
jgi:hypothetical protein